MDAHMLDAPAAGSFPRPELLGLLTGEGTGAAQVMMVEAPRGFGKTILLQQWLDYAVRVSVPHAQVFAFPCATETDFWDAILKASGSGKEKAGEPKDPYARVVRWAEKLTEPFTLVVDNYDQMTGPLLDDRLADLLESFPRLRLLIAGRYFSRLGGPLCAATLEAVRVCEADLSFSESETQQLLESRGVAREDVDESSLELAQGWPLLVELLASQAADQLWFGGIRVDACDVLSSFLHSPGERKLAALIATLPEVNATLLADAMHVPVADMPAVLRPLLANGLVQLCPHTGQARYSVTPIMRSRLRDTLYEYWEAPRIRELQSVHARDIIIGRPHEALDSLIDLGYYRSAEDLLVLQTGKLVPNWREAVVSLRKVPPEVWLERPILAGLRLLMELAGHELGAAEKEYLASGVLEGARLQLESGIADYPLVLEILLILALRRRRQSRRVLTQTADLWERIERATRPDREGIEELRALAYYVTSQGVLLAGDLNKARQIFSEMADLARSLLSVPLKVVGLAGLAFTEAQLGRIDQARDQIKAFEVAAAEFPGNVLPWSVKANYELARALVAISDGGPPRERQVMAVIGAGEGGEEYWVFYALMEASLVRREEGPYLALQRLQSRVEFSARANRPTSPIFAEQLRCALVDLAILCGRYDQAETYLEHADRRSARVLAAAARLALFRLDVAAAARFLGQAAEIEEADPPTEDWFLLLALSTFLTGDKDTAVKEFTRYAQHSGVPDLSGDFTHVPFHLLRDLATVSRERGGADVTAAVDSTPLIARVDAKPELSASQEQTLRYLVQGLTNAEIAEVVSRSENTVKSHLQTIYRGLGVENRHQATVKAIRLGLLEGPGDILEWDQLLAKWDLEQ